MHVQHEQRGGRIECLSKQGSGCVALCLRSRGDCVVVRGDLIVIARCRLLRLSLDSTVVAVFVLVAE